MTGRLGAQQPSTFSWSATRRPAEGFVYADVPTRLAAFLIDLLLAGTSVLVLAAIVGSVYYRWGAGAEFESLLAIEMLLVAVACTLPTALAAWLWHTRRATPGQRLLGLKVAHWRTGERLSIGASLARWVLLYAPLVLLVAYPALVDSAVMRWPPGLLALYEVPWLPPAAVGLPLLWYAALAYPALADRRRVRALHDRLCGSIVVREEPASPLPPSPAEDDVPLLSEQPPFVWLARLGLPATFYLFALAALVLAAEQMSRVIGSSQVELPSIGFAVASVLVVLTPAALVLRVPEAPRTLPLLVLGLAMAAVPRVMPLMTTALDRAGLELLGAVLGGPTHILALLAPVLIGLGLLQLRERGPSRPWLLLAIVAGLLALAVLPLALGLAELASTYDLSWVLIAAAGTGFALWVPASAWLDGDRPRAFWTLLAVALPLRLALDGLSAVAFVLGQPTVIEHQSVLNAIGAAATLAIVATALIAYGRFTPRADHGARG